MTRLLVGPVLRHVGTTDATVWVETDEPCEVTVTAGEHTATERTWTVAGHHYALVLLDGLPPGTSLAYQVGLGGEQAWPMAGATRPPSRIRTLHAGTGRVRIGFGSCRHSRTAMMVGDRHYDADSLAAYSRELAGQDEATWPDAFLMLGDQVYADETSEPTRRRIRARRDIEVGARDQVADFEEYTWLYLESWTDPDVRWLLATVPSAMIFDDHDVRDDWNTSDLWRREMQATDWWQERIVGGLSSYWVYQHLGNLSPAELATNELFQQVRASGADNADALRAFANHADAEADGAKGTRWSFRRDLGRTRVIMIDSRCGRILEEGARSMVSEDEFAWIAEQLGGDYDHLLVGTSLPWLLARALHDLEAWDEVLCDKPGRRGRFGEWLRRAADLEHWASFRRSFERLGDLLAAEARRADGPATVCVLSGDVHHAYISRARFAAPVRAAVYQLTCSPLHNYVPPLMKIAFRVFWSRLAERVVRLLLGTVAEVPAPTLDWERVAGPYFSNELAEFVSDGRAAVTTLRRPVSGEKPAELHQVARVQLAG